MRSPSSEIALANIEPSAALDPPANFFNIHAATELHAMDPTEAVADLAGKGVRTLDLAWTNIGLHLQIRPFFFRVEDVQVAVDVDTRATTSDGVLDRIDFTMAVDVSVAAIQLPSIATVAQLRTSLHPTDAAVLLAVTGWGPTATSHG